MQKLFNDRYPYSISVKENTMKIQSKLLNITPLVLRKTVPMAKNLIKKYLIY